MSRILIIEKDRAVRLLLKEFFRGRGYTVFTSSGTREALKTAGRSKPDLVIIDLLTIGLGNDDVVGAIKRLSPTAKFIGISGIDDWKRTSRINGINGLDFLLEKPFDLKVFSEMVDETLK
ncbi:MAG: response regulator [Firmicutes bacterium]|nr:response regulator [Bacillota bacterium]